MFAKKPNPEKNVVPSTHLVCPLPSGNKYQAAKKWGVPVVSADWLVECARLTSRVPEDPFLVDGSNHPKVDKKKVFMDHLGETLTGHHFDVISLKLLIVLIIFTFSDFGVLSFFTR